MTVYIRTYIAMIYRSMIILAVLLVLEKPILKLCLLGNMRFKYDLMRSKTIGDAGDISFNLRE